MAEAEVNLTYRPLPVAALNVSLGAVVPVGALYVFWTTIVILANSANGFVDFNRAVLLIAAQIFAWICITTLFFLTRDRQIFLSHDGLSFPCLMMFGGFPRTQLDWSDLTAVKFMPGGKGKLILWFGVRRAVIDFRYLQAADVEQLCVALDVWADGADRFPALLEARTSLPGQAAVAAAGSSFTDMWEEELARRFGATNFIPLEPGHKVREGDFVVERQLAFGGASAIYLVQDRNKQKFVLKEAVVPSDSAEDLRNKSIEMLRREAQYLTALHHPALAKVLDYFVDEGRHYLLMEYIEGIDLRRLVREKGIRKVGEVIEQAIQIADIMRYLHGQNPPLIHRDLTPDNIILRDDGSIAIIDFGASNHFLGTATQTLIGKQAYMPAEQLRGKSDQRSDIYSFGATINFLLTGMDPEPLSVSHPKENNADVPAGLDHLVARCTELEASDRPQSMDEVERELLALKSYAK